MVYIIWTLGTQLIWKDHKSLPPQVGNSISHFKLKWVLTESEVLEKFIIEFTYSHLALRVHA